MTTKPSIVLGTSGWSFRDWIGPFYPLGTERTRMLDFYAHEFRAVEVNSTYYRIPHPRTFESIEKKTPPGFEFVVKTHHDMTHRQTHDPDIYRDFNRAILPLLETGKLTGILAQFPYAFRRTPENEGYLRRLKDYLGHKAPLFIEFRHKSWVSDEVFGELDEEGLGYVSVDEPNLPGLMPRIARVTGELGYVRFHGRNRDKWWPHGAPGSAERERGAPDRPRREREPKMEITSAPKTAADLGPLFSGTPEIPKEVRSEPRTSSTRYDYSYTEDELKEWVEKIKQMTAEAKKTFVFFNNCHVGQAATSAKLMRKLLEGEGML
jgi:uncharacterized protein YecE (DUF72 family)